MAVDLSTLSLLQHGVARQLLGQVVRNRRIKFSDLVKSVQPVGVSSEQAKVGLKALQEAHLVAAAGPSIDEFKTYYVTADGLEASRVANI